MWKSTDDLILAIEDAHTRLRNGKTPVDAAHAEARLLTTAARVLLVQLDHAKATGRLRKGSGHLPGMTFGKGS